jgi:hypothetical protein
MMTADPSQQIREEALSLGVIHYVLKPINPLLFTEICQQTFPLAPGDNSPPS